MDYNIIKGSAVAAGVNVYTANLSVKQPKLVDGGLYIITFTNANTIAAPATLNIDLLGAKAINNNNNKVITPNEITDNGVRTLIYNLANDNFKIITPRNTPRFSGEDLVTNEIDTLLQDFEPEDGKTYSFVISTDKDDTVAVAVEMGNYETSEGSDGFGSWTWEIQLNGNIQFRVRWDEGMGANQIKFRWAIFEHDLL